ncbi:MAG: hypothetical protein LIO43_04140 [Clostridiales bacterium]|nr:hypothetical protein [Clostridiales bacterium]
MNNKKKNKKNKNILEKLSDFAFAMSIIGICTIGICPAFGAMGIAVPLAMKNKGAQLSVEIMETNKKSLIGGIIALALFVVDLIILLIFKDKLFK